MVLIDIDQFDGEVISSIESRISYEFKNKQLLIDAFTHPSYLKENPFCCMEDYNKLEFVGDKVWSLCVAMYFERNSTRRQREEYLSVMTHKYLGNKEMGKLSCKMGFDKLILVSISEKKRMLNGVQNENCEVSPKIAADVVESLFGAVMKDSGNIKSCMGVFEIMQPFMEAILEEQNSEFVGTTSNDNQWSEVENYKGYLNELSLKEFKTPPTYSILKQEGPNHAPSFKVSCIVGNYYSEGVGYSKKEAETLAAKLLFIELKNSHFL